MKNSSEEKNDSSEVSFDSSEEFFLSSEELLFSSELFGKFLRGNLMLVADVQPPAV